MYNYILEYLNIIKVNSKMKNTIRLEVTKGYWPSNINKNIKGIKWLVNKVTLKDIEGANLDLKRIHNIRAS